MKVAYDRTYLTCWSRDGSTLIFTGTGNGVGWDLIALRLDGDRKPIPILATRFDESVASLSPDGKWLAYISNETGVSQVYVRPYPAGNGKWQISTETGLEPRWSGDGKTLFYQAGPGMMAAPISFTQSLDIGQRKSVLKELPNLSLESGVTYDLSPDGQHILVTKVQEGNEVFQQIGIVLNWFDEIKTASAQAK